MAQPKEPPLSIRPGPGRLALIDAYAAERGITRHAAALALIDEGLRIPPLMVIEAGEAPRGPATLLVPQAQAQRIEAAMKANPDPKTGEMVRLPDDAVRTAHQPRNWQPMRMPRAAPGSRLKGTKK